jgi:hypothetical protein
MRMGRSGRSCRIARCRHPGDRVEAVARVVRVTRLVSVFGLARAFQPVRLAPEARAALEGGAIREAPAECEIRIVLVV